MGQISFLIDSPLNTSVECNSHCTVKKFKLIIYFDLNIKDFLMTNLHLVCILQFLFMDAIFTMQNIEVHDILKHSASVCVKAYIIF